MHNINRRAFMAHAGAGLLLAGTNLPLLAAEKSDTLRMLVGFAPGGTADTVGRRVGHHLTDRYARTVIVENRSGAGGQIAIQALKNMPNDGSTILITPASMLMIYPHIYKELSYAPLSVTPLSLACTLDFGLAVGPAVPESVVTLEQFLEWLRANPMQASFGSPASGSVPHFIGELLARESKIDLRHVPYRGSQPAVLDMIGGQLPCVSAPVGEFLQHLPEGKVRLLATSGAERSRFAPDIQTYTEQGFPRLQLNEWFGFFGPAGVPAATVAALSAALDEALAEPEVIKGLETMGLEAQSSSSEALRERLRADHEKWRNIVETIGFKVEI